MPVLAVLSRKGGSGKTAVAVNLAWALRQLGPTVLLVDLDPQAAASLYWAETVTDPPAVTVDALLDGRAHGPADPHIKALRPGLGLLAASTNLAVTDYLLAARTTGRHPLRALLQTEQPWGWIILDTPPSLGVLTLNACVACDLALVVALPEFAAVNPLYQTLAQLAAAREEYNPSARLAGILLNQWRRTRRIDHAVRNRLRADGAPVLGPTIRHTVRIAESYAQQRPVGEAFPLHPVNLDFRNLAREMIRHAQDAP